MLGGRSLAADTPQERAERLSRVCGNVCRVHRLRIFCEGRVPSKPVIYVCNHLGYVDPVAFCSVVPCSPIAKSEVSQWPGLGSLARRTGAIFVERGNPYSGALALRKARRSLNAGVSVLNFPEGTTTTGQLLEFHRGVFGLAEKMGVPVVPVAVSFERRALCWVGDENLVSHYFRVVAGRQHKIQLLFGSELRGETGLKSFGASQRARRWIAENGGIL